MPKICPYCNAQNRDTARFCAQCAAPLKIPEPDTRAPATEVGMLAAQHILADRYLILNRVGRGGMGAVYKAADTRIPGKLWAVKELSDAAITDPLERNRASQDFHREAHLLATLDHPNIPKVIDSFSEGGQKYVVMEFIEGETLAERMDRLGGEPLPPDTVINWGLQLCDALSYMHSQTPPVIFRDIKPGNVMITTTGEIKLIDFGIARLFKPGKSKDTQIFGTSGYAPPEQYGYGQTDERSDVFALGATLHHLLTGVDPTKRPSFSFEDVRGLNPSVPIRVGWAIMKALEPAAGDRWRSMAEMRAALSPTDRVPEQRAAPIPVVETEPKPQQPRTRRPTTRLIMAAAGLSNTQLTVGVVLLLLLSALGVWFGAPVMYDVPLLWRNVPLLAIVGPMAHAASRRRWVALAAFTPIAFLGGVVLWQRLESMEGNYGLLLAGAVVGGLFMEGWLVFLPRITRSGGDEAWVAEMLWLGLMAMIGIGIFYSVPTLESGFVLVTNIGRWIGALVLGCVGWFLGDLIHQYMYLRQTGYRRPY
jgi:serine/threonine-protein kinase